MPPPPASDNPKELTFDDPAVEDIEPRKSEVVAPEVTVVPPIVEGSTPVILEKLRSSFTPFCIIPKHGLGSETSVPWCELLSLSAQDSFGRIHDRGKEVPKATKLLMKLFPNKVAIDMPQDEALLASWKNQLDRDALYFVIF